MSEYRTYVISYRFQGANWGTTIKATSADEAKSRIEQMGAFGTVDGELMASIPGPLGPIARLWVWLANALRRP